MNQLHKAAKQFVMFLALIGLAIIAIIIFWSAI